MKLQLCLAKPLSDSMQVDPPWWSIKYPQEIELVPASELQELGPLLQGQDAGNIHGQIVLEAYSGNQALLGELGPYLTARWPSQIFQAMSDGPILLLVLVLVWLVARKPGIIAGWFLLAYGVLRILTELFREPDEGVALTLGLSRGQTLSVLMILIGIGMIIWCAGRTVDRIGGLLKPMDPEENTGTSRGAERPGGT